MANGPSKENSWASSVPLEKSIRTELEVLQREVSEMKQIHVRLDRAITKITDVSSSIHIMLAVHEEKIERQEEIINDNALQIEAKRKELAADIKEIHSRITTINRELYDRVSNTEQHIIENNKKHIDDLKVNLNNRVGVLENWRWLIIGGAIVVGFVLNKFIQF
jgi:predicted  nucleic acid-binding Zn-ribbon protein|tara:strand:+ start:32 stop:523 length:492 start_codon:yes stop_codon:yes gene_type:complete